MARDRRGLLGVGVAAGLLPCPSALVVLLAAIALHRVGFGLALILAFSVGLAATITAIGLVAVLAKRAFSRSDAGRPRHPAAPGRERARDPRGRRRHHSQRAPGGALAMFGLDDNIAALSHGGSILIVLLVATLLGLRHATDPDHIAAVTTLAGLRPRARPQAGRRARSLVGARPRPHARRLRRADPPLRGVPAGRRPARCGDRRRRPDRVPRRPAARAAPAPARARRHEVRSPLGAFGIGLVHGMGGSAGVGVLLLAAIPSTALALVSLVVLAALHRGLDDDGDHRLRRHSRRATRRAGRRGVRRSAWRASRSAAGTPPPPGA